LGLAHERRTRHAEILRNVGSVRSAKVFTDSDPGTWLPALQRVASDLLIAFEWLLRSDAAAATLMAVRLAPFWKKVQEYARGREMLESALAMYPDADELRANALLWLGILHIPGRELGLENVSFSHPFRDWRRRDRRPPDANQRGREASAWLRQGVELAVTVGCDELETLGRTFLGVALGELGDLEGAETESVAATKAGAKVAWLESLPTILNANLALARGDHAQASTLARRALELERDKNDAFQMITVYDLHARIERSRGAHDEAAEYFRLALDDYARPSGQLGGVALLSMAMGLSKAAAGDSVAARSCFGEALSIGNEVGMPRVESAVRRGHALLAYLDSDFTQARHHLELALDHARQIGCGDEIGSTLSRLGQVAEKAGDVPKALETYRAALRTFVPEWATPDLALALEGVAACRLKRGEHRAAAYLLGSASLVREAVQTPAEWWTSAGASAAMARLELGAAVFDAAWESGRSDHIRSVIAEALS
jgi:tetratricopeptide (TPR) repeat protein